MSSVTVKKRPVGELPLHRNQRVEREAVQERRDIKPSIPSVRVFFALTFALGWGIATLMIVFSKQVEAIFGEIGYTNPVFILVVWSPAMAASYLIWKHYGMKGLMQYYKRLSLW